MNQRVALLYVEDNGLERWGFFRMIHKKSLPYEVTAVETLAEARAALAKSRFDLIVADYNLPDGVVTELFDEVRDTPFILLTATLEEQLVLRTLERGADEFLPKAPLGRHLEALPFAVEKTLYRKRIRERERRLTQELREARETLEIRVRQRTAELASANAELRLAKEAAEAANRAKSTFLANMSHELRTPLSAILGTTELLFHSRLSDRQREFIATVRQSGEALLTVIDDILEFSRIEAGKLVLAEETFDLRECLCETIDSFAGLAQEKGLELTGVIHPDVPPMVTGDPDSLRQVVVSLLGNAIKFTARGEVRLEVACESPAEQEPVLHFTVSDTGIGVPEEKRAAIFERFEQADGSLARRHGGTGLGLAIAARLVGLMHGRIWVESEVGQGSRFHFTVCLKPAQPGTIEEESFLPAAWRPAQAGLRILLAEPSLVQQKLAAALLEGAGHTVAAVKDGAAALAAVASAQFDLLLLDVQMPERDGLEVAARLRADEAQTGGHVPIIAIATDATPEERQHCLEVGMDGYIGKPIRADELFAAIAACRCRAKVGDLIPIGDGGPADE